MSKLLGTAIRLAYWTLIVVRLKLESTNVGTFARGYCTARRLLLRCPAVLRANVHNNRVSWDWFAILRTYAPAGEVLYSQMLEVLGLAFVDFW